jgi:hypothetical protein
MSTSMTTVCLMLSLAAAPVASAQADPIVGRFRAFAAEQSKYLLAAAEAMPEEKYGFKPTAAQWTFGKIVVHIAGDNLITCGAIAGEKPTEHPKVSATASKAEQVAALRSSLEFCEAAIAKVTDAQLTDTVSLYGGPSLRVGALIGLVEDWSDHYSQQAGYLRLNGILPPTAKKS